MMNYDELATSIAEGQSNPDAVHVLDHDEIVTALGDWFGPSHADSEPGLKAVATDVVLAYMITVPPGSVLTSDEIRYGIEPLGIPVSDRRLRLTLAELVELGVLERSDSVSYRRT